ncbi:MAG: hypothetical protein WA667_12560 [Candidatus Nitrosopolaris sp.]
MRESRYVGLANALLRVLRNGQLNDPILIVLDTKGNLYVVDSGNNRIQEFGSNGDFIRTWDSFGICDGQFNSSIRNYS